MTFEINLIEINNFHIVLHNRASVLLWEDYVNVEAVYGNCGGKYVCKYVTKGNDSASVEIVNS